MSETKAVSSHRSPGRIEVCGALRTCRALWSAAAGRSFPFRADCDRRLSRGCPKTKAVSSHRSPGRIEVCGGLEDLPERCGVLRRDAAFLFVRTVTGAVSRMSENQSGVKPPQSRSD